MRIENIFNPFFIRNTKCVFSLEKLKGKAQNTKQESKLIRVGVVQVIPTTAPLNNEG